MQAIHLHRLQRMTDELNDALSTIEKEGKRLVYEAELSDLPRGTRLVNSRYTHTIVDVIPKPNVDGVLVNHYEVRTWDFINMTMVPDTQVWDQWHIFCLTTYSDPIKIIRP